MSKTRDEQHTDPTASRRVVVASRGAVNPKACQLVRSLPLHPMGLVALSVNQGRPKDRQTGSYTCAGVSSGSKDAADESAAIGSLRGLSKECASEVDQIEAVYRNGDLVRALAELADSDDIAVTMLFEESDAPQCRYQVARDASAILRRTRKPVLVVAGECRASTKGNLLVAVGGSAKRSMLAECRIDRLADLACVEVVVLSVARPFRPAFSRVAVGMRSSQREVMREVHDEQVQDATADAMCLCEMLRASGAKSWAVGKVGKLISETSHTAESCDCALICIPVDYADIVHEKRMRAFLSELLGCARTPVLMLPP